MQIKNNNNTPTFAIRVFSDKQREVSGDKREFVGFITHIQTKEETGFSSPKELIQFIESKK